jgi:hypothetical protein
VTPSRAPRPATPTATLNTRETVVELRNAEPIPSGSADDPAGSGDFVPSYVIISTDYEGRPAQLMSVTVTATGRAGERARWASITNDPDWRLRALPESLRTIVCAFEPSLAEHVAYRPYLHRES